MNLNYKDIEELYTIEELKEILLNNNKEEFLFKYELLKENKNHKENMNNIIEIMPGNLLKWEDCIFDKCTEKTNKIYIRIMKNILNKLGINTEYCDLKIFLEDSTLNRIMDLIKDDCLNTQEQTIQVIKNYLKYFVVKAGLTISYKIYMSYESKHIELDKLLKITKETKDIIKFEDLLELFNNILNDKIELTNEQTKNDYNIVIKIICLIYSYGYENNDINKIGILRYQDLLNTEVIYEDIEKDIKYKDIDIEKHYISYKDKKWYFKSKYTKNSKDRIIDLSEDFLIKLKELRNKTKTKKLLTKHYKGTSSIIKIIHLYNMPSLNDMRKSAEQYSHDNFDIEEGLRYTKNLGHTIKTNITSYINQIK